MLGTETPKERQSTLVIAIGSALIREVVQDASRHLPNLCVTGEAQDWEHLQSALHCQEPNVLVVSATLPGCISLQALATLVRHYPDTKVVLIVPGGTSPELRASLPAIQPHAIVTSETRMADLIRVLALVSQDMVVFPAVVVRPWNATSDLGEAFLRDKPLSRRERELLQLLAQGSSGTEAAMQLGIGRRTIHTHLERINRKLGTSNRVHAVAMATSAGVVSPARHS